MRERTEQMIHSMNKSRHKRRRINAFITALAVLTGGNVFWELRETGMAVTEDDLCTMEAHEHSDNCYDSDGTLICGMDEHIHTADCYSDAEADTETPEVWEMSFTAPENAARQEQAALIAESQLGYTESTDNFILSENGVKQGYTRYGEWYGNPYGDWNTMFTYFCMYYAGVSAEEFPYGGNATTWQAKLKESELLHSPDSEPQRGNIILLDTDADGEADLTGIITDTEELLTVIEGDCDNTVAEVKYQYDDSQILGYVALPEPDTPAEAEAVPMEFSAESPSGIQVSASAEKGTFPEDAVMTVSDISREEAMQAAENLESQTIDAVAVDITFTDAEGTELEPAEDKTVQVQITLPDEMKLSGDEYSLLHISDEGDVQKVEEAEVSETGAEFLAERFSIYVVTSARGATDKNALVMGDGQLGGNNVQHPYVIGIGENIEVWYSGEYINAVDKYSRGFTVYNNYDYITRTSSNEVVENGYRKAFFTGKTEGICRIVKITREDGWGDETFVADDLWIRVVDHPVFIMNNGNRVLLESNTISANVGDTFTLSLNGYNAYEIARKENVDSNTAYDYSESLYRGKPDYSRGDGNTYVDFVCKAATGDTPQTITVNGRPITVNITNNHLYKVENENRNLIDDGITIVAAINDKFTLSVNDGANHLLASNNFSVEAYVMEGGYLNRGKTHYDGININGANVGTTDVEFTCLKDGTYTFQANNKNITVIINENYMIMDDGRRLLFEQAIQELNNKDDKTIYLLEGESFTFSRTGENKGNEFSVTNSEILTKGTPTNNNGNTDVTFTALKHGNTTITVGNQVVDIVVNHPLYVKTAIMDRDIDRVNEWVSSQSWLTKRNGYVPNTGLYYPYQLYNNDTFTIYTPVDHLTNPQFVVSDSSILELLSTQIKDGMLYATYKAHNSTETNLKSSIQLKSENDVIRTMYIDVLQSGNKILDHADIEIADGGIYTLTKIIRHQNGTIEKKITQYIAYVNDINSSTLYQANGDPCTFYIGNGSPDEDISAGVYEGIHGYVKDDYWKDERLSPGNTQYEYTSKYKMDSNGNVTQWSRKKYRADDVEYAIFDTNLMLIPDKEKTITYNANGTVASETNFTDVVDKTPKIIDNVLFTMDHQDVLDAFNKCPNHTGLDFTIMAYSAMVEFDLNKELTGGTVAENQFTFEVLQKEVILARKFAGLNYRLDKSKRNEMSEKGMNFKGAYKIFYNDGEFKWGDGIDKDAALRELSTLSANPLFSNCNLSDTAAIFNLANSDKNDEEKARQAIVLRILQQYLTNPNPAESLIETTEGYEMPSEGFYLLSFESEPIQTVQNDASGLITFNALHFEKEDSYKYIIREKVPENTNNILYDRKELDLDITVSKNDKQLTADITSDMTNFKFTNHTTYRLPDTGGKGVIPYIVGGAAMMGAALMLLHRKRKEA